MCNFCKIEKNEWRKHDPTRSGIGKERAMVDGREKSKKEKDNFMHVLHDLVKDTHCQEQCLNTTNVVRL